MILQNGKTIHLQGNTISYVMYRNEREDLLHFHYGKKIADCDYSNQAHLLFYPAPQLSNTPNLTSHPQEYPGFGRSDLRHPAFTVTNCFGNPVTELKYESCRILKNQAVQVQGMPSLSANGQADTLEITLADHTIDLEVKLYYVVFEELDVIARHTVIVNKSQKTITLNSAYSANLDLPMGQYDLIHFTGDWGQERGMERTPIHRGMRSEIADHTGRGSRWNNPFVMVASADADETQGEVYALNLIYSGNHSTVVFQNMFDQLRITQGISPWMFTWQLKPGEEFCTPQCVMCYSDSGFETITHTYHKLYRNHLIRSKWNRKPRPILINNWEATYFDFNEEKLLAMAQKAKQAGIELFVLDDGWFGTRNDPQSGLGDWVVNRNKIPSGLDGLARKLNEMGMLFGLWFEPEMVSPDSDLYRAHPDWIVRVPQQDPVQMRWQYILDLTKPEVCQHIISAVSDVLENANISYVKWDMNRFMSDVPDEGFYHRYVLGYYQIMEAVTKAFPEVLFEGCCSGGGRFDPGVLTYMPQIWTSDNTDAIARLKIQYSTSMCYPLSTMCAHVSPVPSHQNCRITSLKTRADVAYAGVFGYELDVTQMTDEELAQIAEQTAFAKHIQPLIHNGILYRLRSPYKTNECIWQVVSEEKDHAFIMACRVLSVLNRNRHYDPMVRLRGLDPDTVYEDMLTGKCYSGSLLMYRGITVDYAIEDFATCIMELKSVRIGRNAGVNRIESR